ncbi:MAG: Bro-N domain-containing protein, partial [Spirochaetota bacterium]
QFGPQEVRELEKDGEPWFVAKDVAEILGYSDTQAMTRSLDEDEKGVQTLHTLGGNQELTLISESGLYSAILRSTKPEAKAFKRWVTHEVLPSIRREGRYELERDKAKLTSTVLDAQDRLIESQTAQIDLHKELAEQRERYRKSHTPLSELERQSIEAGVRAGFTTRQIAETTRRSMRTVQVIKKQMEVGA